MSLRRTVAILCFLPATVASAQHSTLADTVLMLDRAGRWEDVLRLVRLGQDSALSRDDRCSIRVSTLSAQIRLSFLEAARRGLVGLQADCAASPVLRRHVAEISSIRRELADAARSMPATGVDFSAVDAFWALADTLSRDIDPSGSTWLRALRTPGYRLAIASVPTVREDLTLALKPSRRATYDSLSKRDDDRAARLAHIIRAVAFRAELVRFRDSLAQNLPIADAIRGAARFLPAGATTRSPPPLVAFAIFRDDSYSQPAGVIVDLLFVYENSLMPMLAHEFHHTYLHRANRPTPSRTNDPDGLLLSVRLQAMRDEGIADLIDKPYPISSPNPVMGGYVSRYNASYSRTPVVLRTLDSLLAAVADDPTQMRAVSRRVRSIMATGAHPYGAYVARKIYEAFGVDSLFPGITSPAAFLRAYASAERERGNPPPFSAKALSVLALLERRYWGP
jgi:Putative zinc dependent peptidase (DUF5700)